MNAMRTLLLLDKHLEAWKFPFETPDKIGVMYQNCDVKDGIVSMPLYGTGETFEAACEDYLRKIRGKTLIFNARSKNREEVKFLDNKEFDAEKADDEKSDAFFLKAEIADLKSETEYLKSENARLKSEQEAKCKREKELIKENGLLKERADALGYIISLIVVAIKGMGEK